MILDVLHKLGLTQPGMTATPFMRSKRRRSCSTCRTFIRTGAIRCGYCRQLALTRWHKLLLGAAILVLSFLLLNVLNSVHV